MLYRISVAERGLTGIANIFRSRLSRLDDLLRAGTVPLCRAGMKNICCFLCRLLSPIVDVTDEGEKSALFTQAEPSPRRWRRLAS